MNKKYSCVAQKFAAAFIGMCLLLAVASVDVQAKLQAAGNGHPVTSQKEKPMEAGLSAKCKAALPAGQKAKQDDIKLFMSIGEECNPMYNIETYNPFKVPPVSKVPDTLQALKWYRKAAELGYAEAQYMICAMRDIEEDSAITSAEAFKWCLEAAKQTDKYADAAYLVARMYENGQGTEQDLVQAYLWTAVAARYEVNGTKKDCVEDFKKLSDKLTPDQLGEAQRLFLQWRPQKKMVGKYGGIGVALAEAQGVFYVNSVLVGSPAKFAGIQPDDNILMIDGVSVKDMSFATVAEKLRGLRGTSVEVTIDRSGKSGRVQQQFKIVREDLSSMAPIAHDDFQHYFDNNMGVMYSNGCGVKQDYAEAAKWFRESALSGYPEAQSALGELHESGKGVKQDWSEAYFWYSLAAQYDLQAREKKELAAKHLSPEQTIEAVKRVAAWQPPESSGGGVIQVIRGPMNK